MARRQMKTRRRRRHLGGSPGPNVYVFYHIYCNKFTMPILKDQVAKIIFSGLYSRVDAIYCFLAGEEAHITEAEKFLNRSGEKFTIKEKGPGDTSFERFTLSKIPKYTTDEDKFLYLHTKGVSEKHANGDNVYWWRTWMEYNLMHRFEECIEKLKDYDIVGVGFTQKMIGPHFSGNFWWTKGSYFNTLPKNKDGTMKIGNEYLDPENFIFKGKAPKHLDMDANRSSNPNEDWYSSANLARLANAKKGGARRKTR